MDDEPDILEQARMFLVSEDERLYVETCLTVEDALDLPDEGDCIVSDYQMTDADGLEFLRIVREEKITYSLHYFFENNEDQKK